MGREDIRNQNGQDFRKPNFGEIHVGQCVWIRAIDPNVGKSWLEGPFFVVDTVHEGTMSEHFRVFSSHLGYETRVRYGDIWIPIIDTIDPPRGHNI